MYAVSKQKLINVYFRNLIKHFKGEINMYQMTHLCLFLNRTLHKPQLTQYKSVIQLTQIQKQN
jgi:hypothetical protein